jgi:addiction module HigA family antidote
MVLYGIGFQEMRSVAMRERTRPPVHPGGILKRQYLEPLGLGISQAALALGVSRKTLSKLINARGAVTPEMALRLARAFNTTPELWLNLQHNYDLWHAVRPVELLSTVVLIPKKPPR